MNWRAARTGSEGMARKPCRQRIAALRLLISICCPKAEEKGAWDQLDSFYKYGLGYAQEMANHPQTLYAVADSPVGRLLGVPQAVLVEGVEFVSRPLLLGFRTTYGDEESQCRDALPARFL
jgi:hypothetical protein